jgi:Salmonella virulence plasmid 65kDa B protein/Insecticide toxin TcdB middle/N-terminal region/FG-GAP-like repeat/Phage tail fibre adhesin Gp38
MGEVMGARDVVLRIRGSGFFMPSIAMALNVAVFLFVLHASPAVAQMMALPGKPAVDANGGAGYSIPISVPSGTAGLAPTLSFQYNNQSGNGLLGMGWSLGGLPAVSRCPRTIAQDGLAGGTNYDVNDRFCLDGQRLMAINNGTYGADGTEYRTEIESFSRVISHGTAGTGPAWFEVHTKSGQIMEFGNTTDSHVLVQGRTDGTARSWAVNKVSDTKGNYFAVTYTPDTPHGQTYPARIDYTGNAAASLQPYNSVQFLYAPRPDTTQLYHAGSLIQTMLRLTDVQTYTGANLVADYRLAYDTTITSVSILTSITLCAADGSCLPPTSFAVTNSNTWAGNSNFTPLNGSFFGTTVLNQSPTPVQGAYGAGITTYPNGWSFGSPPWTKYDPITGDFNGDGKTDFAFAAADAIYVMLSNGDGTFSGPKFTYPNGWNFGSPPSQGYAPISGDFNGDGKSDFAFAGATVIYVFLSNGDGTFSGSPFTYPNGWNFAGGPTGSPLANYTPIVGDFNGDGRTDFAFAGQDAIYVMLSNGDGTFSGIKFTYPNGWNFGSPPTKNYWSIVGDFDGNGKTDFAFTAGTAIYVFLSNGDGIFSASKFTYPNNWNFMSPGPTSPPPIVGDFNGDGKTDFLFSNATTSYTMLSKGDGTFAGSTFTYPNGWIFTGGSGSPIYTPIVGDFNGDGKADYALVEGTFSYFMLGNGDGSFSLSQFSYPNGWNLGNPPSTNYAPIAGDFNGDGKVDFAFAGATTLNMLQATSSPPNYLLNTVTSGLGATTAFNYQPLTNAAVYTKGTGSLFPIADVQAPIYVVSRVDSSNGSGGNFSASYAYAGAKMDSSGRGFLGFRQMAATDLQTNIVRTTNYRQDYPYIALVASETQTLGGATLNTTNNAYGYAALGGTRYQVFLTQSQASSFDLDGSTLPTVTTSYQYDTFGDATQITVSATDGHSKTTTNTYTNDTVNWLLGRLANATVTSQISQSGSAPPVASTPVVVTIYSNTKNFNLWNYLTTNNMVTGTPDASLPVNVTIASGAVIGSASPSVPAFDTGTFPSGSTVQITNNGTIVGAGGNGGNGASCSTSTPATSGAPGGAAMRAQVALSIANNGSVWGGGGGGGGGAGGIISSPFSSAYLAGGGGGGGTEFGGGGAAGAAGAVAGSAGALATGGAGGAGQGSGNTIAGSGGNGGGPGLAGGNGTNGNASICLAAGAGGAAGAAVAGNSFITWTAIGDRRGALN